MAVLVRLTKLIRDGLASEAEARAALASLAQHPQFLGGRVCGGALVSADRATGQPRSAGPWTVQAFLPVMHGPHSPHPEAACEAQVVGYAFRLCGLEAGVVGLAWADRLARQVTETGPWTRTVADLQDDLGKPAGGARVHARNELVAHGIAALNEAQIDLCLEAVRQQWAHRRREALANVRDAQSQAAADMPDPPPRTPERMALESAAWEATHEDFKGVGADGARRMLYLHPKTGGTESWPIELLPTKELRRSAGSSAPRCEIKLADLDLSAPHGELPTVVMRGTAWGEVARATSVAPGDRVRFRADVELVKDVTAAASMAELRAFIRAHRGIPATDTDSHRVTQDDLAVHAYGLAMEVWWPETQVERPAGGAS